ncbi:MAG: GumC family protein [Sphingobacteriaceae bacterium]
MQETDHKVTRKLPNQEIDYFKIGKILLSRWYWIAGSVFVCLLFSYIYLWYTPKMFATGSTMKFDEKKSEISDLVSVINSSDRMASKVQSESYVIQSRRLILNAISDLDYQVSFYIAGRVRTTEIYPQKPLDIQLIQFDSLEFYRNIILFKAIDEQKFSLKHGQRSPVNYAYEQAITVGKTTFKIRKPPAPFNAGSEYSFRFNLPEDFLGRVRGGLQISEKVKNSNIVSLNQTDQSPDFAADILNAIMNEYLNYDKTRKMQSATQIIHFIDDQLDFLSTEVKGSEKSLEAFKKTSRVMDISSTADYALGKVKDAESQRSLLKIQLIAIDQLQQQIEKEKDNVGLNFNMEGTIDPLLSGLINNLNNLLLERNSLLKTYNANSQPVQDLQKQVIQLKDAAFENITSSRQRIQKNLDFLGVQLAQANLQINALPSAERDLVSLKRDFDINEKVYSFLSEKKLEAQISRSAIMPGATIIEEALPNFGPVSPNSSSIYRTAVVLGILIGLGLIIMIRMLNPFIYDKETVESLTTIPIIGIIRKFPGEVDEDNTQILSLSKPKSIFAESVRSVRTNLSFMASDKSNKVICITSEVAGEGKSFVAVNLASTLSLIDKKVIIVAADLRRSRLHRTFQTNNDLGLSSYLAHQCGVKDIIYKTSLESMDFIPSGPVPPNPSELLHHSRMQQLVAELKAIYDIIVIDTAPIGLVSDAIPLIRMSDINLFVIRSGKSKFYAATIPQRVSLEYNLDNTVIVLNAFSEDLLHSRYYTTKYDGENHTSGYYYYSDYNGYSGSGYYTDDESKWWQIKFWINKFRKKKKGE